MRTFGKAIEDGDWRAAEAAMKLAFPEYRQNAKVEVSATANAGNIIVQITAEQIAELQELRRKALQERNR